MARHDLPPSDDDGTRRLDHHQTNPGPELGVIDVNKPGLYRFDGSTLRVADQKLKPLVEAADGAIMWLADNSEQPARLKARNRRANSMTSSCRPICSHRPNGNLRAFHRRSRRMVPSTRFLLRSLRLNTTLASVTTTPLILLLNKSEQSLS